MKIISKEEFLKLPAGVMYMEYESSAFSGLRLKGETWTHDYIELDLFQSVGYCDTDSEMLNLFGRMVETGESQDIDFEMYGRNGMYEDNMYAIIEQKDLDDFLKHLFKQGYYEKKGLGELDAD